MMSMMTDGTSNYDYYVFFFRDEENRRMSMITIRIDFRFTTSLNFSWPDSA